VKMNLSVEQLNVCSHTLYVKHGLPFLSSEFSSKLISDMFDRKYSSARTKSEVIANQCTGLFKKKYTLSRIYFTKSTDAKSTSCVRMERKSHKVLISMI
jgi:hypothetical protein